jgi:rhodanese-related sulfurtransferase
LPVRPSQHNAAETLTDLGYRHVYNVTGSMNVWLAAGFPVESGRR